MLFTLIYRGPLKSNGNVKDKHDIRRTLHRQLVQLWKYPPLNSHTGLASAFVGHGGLKAEPKVLRTIASLNLAPVFPKSQSILVSLDILLLRPEPPGAFIVSGGDIDNRLKTLFDALRTPVSEQELPTNFTVQADENPFLTLLEDDQQVVRVNVETDVLLEPVSSQSEVQLFLRVQTRVTSITYANAGLL